MIGNSGSRNSRKYNFNTPATELMSDASVVSANGSSPRSKPSRKLEISTCEPDTRKIPWWWRPGQTTCSNGWSKWKKIIEYKIAIRNQVLPYKFITRMQLRIINGISSPVASRYSSNEPPNSFGWPVIFMRPIRLRFGTCVLAKSVAFAFSVESLANSVRSNSALASSRAIRDVPRIYSRIF